VRARALRHKEIVERVRLDLLQLANLLLIPANRVGGRASAKSDQRQADKADRRVVSLQEGLIAAFDEVADELAEVQDEVADAVMLSTVRDRLASAKDALTPRSRCCASGRKTPRIRMATQTIAEREDEACARKAGE
jgi:hypothetical protein